jgi:hypothetical protein
MQSRHEKAAPRHWPRWASSFFLVSTSPQLCVRTDMSAADPMMAFLALEAAMLPWWGEGGRATLGAKGLGQRRRERRGERKGGPHLAMKRDHVAAARGHGGNWLVEGAAAVGGVLEWFIRGRYWNRRGAVYRPGGELAFVWNSSFGRGFARFLNLQHARCARAARLSCDPFSHPCAGS